MSALRASNLLLAGLIAACLSAAVVGERGVEWRRLSIAAGAEALPLELRTPAGQVDRCPTCHRAALPGGAPGAERALRAHPRVPGHPDLGRTGCSSCHSGQGRRLDRDAHGPALGAGREPFLRGPYLQARCARCHVPGALAGASVLDRGMREVLEGACAGCHQPGRLEQGLGPDLRALGRRSEAELRRAVLDPEENHSAAVMWSLRWRFDQATADGRAALTALITALLALADSPEPYRAAWARPGLRVDADCAGCHLEGSGPRGARHRCALLVGNASLRCRSCHPERPKGQGECPQLAAARPTCAVCHLRSDDGARVTPR